METHSSSASPYSASALTAYFRRMDEDMQSFLIMAFIVVVAIVFITYMIYLRSLRSKECAHMNTLYPSINGNLRPITDKDSNCKYKLFDYYIKSAYNACSGGSYKNDYVDICNLKAVLKEGVRCLDFELYSMDSEPIVSSSLTNSYYVKETFNSVNFSEVMNTVVNYGFSGGTCPNSTDPILIHLRIKSENQGMYSNLAKIFKSYTNFMLGKEYSYENSGRNLGSVPLLSLRNKIVLIVDRSNPAFLQNEELLEYINLTSNSVFMRALPFENVKNSPDTHELTEFNRRDMTLVYPTKGDDPTNPSGYMCRAYGCQMVAMRYQYVDNYLLENTQFFDRCGYAFCLKPEELRYKEVTIPDPIPQKEEYSYKTREMKTDFYNFKY